MVGHVGRCRSAGRGGHGCLKGRRLRSGCRSVDGPPSRRHCDLDSGTPTSSSSRGSGPFWVPRDWPVDCCSPIESVAHGALHRAWEIRYETPCPRAEAIPSTSRRPCEAPVREGLPAGQRLLPRHGRRLITGPGSCRATGIFPGAIARPWYPDTTRISAMGGILRRPMQEARAVLRRRAFLRPGLRGPGTGAWPADQI